MVMFVVMIIVLAVRPQGLFGSRTEYRSKETP